MRGGFVVGAGVFVDEGRAAFLALVLRPVLDTLGLVWVCQLHTAVGTDVLGFFHVNSATPFHGSCHHGNIISMSVKQYDLVVVGAGSGQNVAVACADQYDWKVALVEKGPLGGTCLNRGCIPSKMIIHAADVAEEIRSAEKFGIRAKIEAIDFAAVTRRANEHVDAEAVALEAGVQKHPKIDLYKGTAEFVRSKEVQVISTDGSEPVASIAGDRILIAAGARPAIPPIPGLNDPAKLGSVEYWTSTEALRQTKQPKSLIVIGGGYIAVELGHFYGALGTEVTVVEMLDRLVSREDDDVAQTFTRVFSEKYEVLLQHKVQSVAQDGQGQKSVVIEDAQGQTRILTAEAILIATGLRPNTDLLKLENTGVKTNDQGYIDVDEFMQTTEENVWALGDIVGKAPFKHGANYEAQHIFWNLPFDKAQGKRKDGEKRAVDYTVMPHAIFSLPQVAGVGFTEREAVEKNLKFQISNLKYSQTGMGVALGEEDGFVKFIIDPEENKILGCHILGPEAATLLHEVVVAMTAGGDVGLIKNAIHIHPALAEVVRRAL